MVWAAVPDHVADGVADAHRGDESGAEGIRRAATGERPARDVHRRGLRAIPGYPGVRADYQLTYTSLLCGDLPVAPAGGEARVVGAHARGYAAKGAREPGE